MFPNGSRFGHPHVCGEEGLFCLLVYLCKGTPPRVWGRVTEYGSNPDTQRDTPTCVGKSTRMANVTCNNKGHPHVCGEEDVKPRLELLSWGTPPRVWGRAMLYAVVYRQWRDTPTCVGKSNWRKTTQGSKGGHPHVCGEEYVNKTITGDYQGTPPRVWGRGVFCHFCFDCLGDTPTCVGKRFLCLEHNFRVERHPHVCGEEVGIPCFLRSSEGTPPRVWGRVQPVKRPVSDSRDTPTCVGKSLMAIL